MPTPTTSGAPASPRIHTIGGVPMSTDCQIDGVPAQCGFVTVYENRAANSGRELKLLVAIFPALDPNPKPDPIFFLAGGPGGNAVGSFTYALSAFPELHRDHDFVLVDQRGTGQYGAVKLQAQVDVTALDAPGIAALQSAVRSALASVDADPRFYTSWVAADDLDQVREDLGYDQINLFGGSYGATMAQIYLAAHPEHVRTVTLTGVTLLDVPVFERSPISAQHALDKVLDRCAADTACHAAYPDIRSDFAKALATSRTAPVRTDVKNPQTGQPIVLDESTFGGAVEQLTVSLFATAELPRAIHHAATGDWSVIANAAASFIGPPEADPSTLLMFVAIRCSEAWARWDPETTARNGANSYETAELVRAAQAYKGICSVWPKTPVPATDGQAVRSDKPVLLLVGGADPIDPPENSADAPIELPNSVTAVFPAGGHCVERYGCAPKLMTQFIEAGTAKDLDVSCAQSAQIPPFNVAP